MNHHIRVYEKWHIPILVSVMIICPNPTWEHFIWPLEYCVLADFCNHTWIPECGIENATTRNQLVHKRLFIDECDMYEYNCDNQRAFVVTNYSLCFGGFGACLTPALRMGNYKLVNDDRRMVFDPTDKYGHTHTEPTTRLTFPTTIRPNLPAHMLHGRRRWTPHGPLETRKQKNTKKTTKKSTKPSTRKITTTTKRSTIVLKKIAFMKSGKRFVKIIKGFATTTKRPSTRGSRRFKRVTRPTKQDSDFLE